MSGLRAWQAKWLKASWRETTEVTQTFPSAGGGKEERTEQTDLAESTEQTGMSVSPRSGKTRIRSPLARVRYS
jgi:hypothetical protein